MWSFKYSNDYLRSIKISCRSKAIRHPIIMYSYYSTDESRITIIYYYILIFVLVSSLFNSLWLDETHYTYVFLMKRLVIRLSRPTHPKSPKIHYYIIPIPSLPADISLSGSDYRPLGCINKRNHLLMRKSMGGSRRRRLCFPHWLACARDCRSRTESNYHAAKKRFRLALSEASFPWLFFWPFFVIVVVVGWDEKERREEEIARAQREKEEKWTGGTTKSAEEGKRGAIGENGFLFSIGEYDWYSPVNDFYLDFQ